tara:strand:- start:2634 stop:6992 length:4359 start_codon:yes stop_codon:yes gene_type:complete
MPYKYLTYNESDLNNGIVSCSYFADEFQSLYEQKMSSNEMFFGTSEKDLIEFTLYDSDQNVLSFNTINPSISYSILQGTYFDINQKEQSYNFKKPFSNVSKFDNEVLLNVQENFKSLNTSPGLYYGLYNFVRDVAGNRKNKLVIKEISPSRTELRFSLAFDQNSNESSKLDYDRISSFAQKKFLFLQISNQLETIIDENYISENFQENSDELLKNKVTSNLGLNNDSELLEFLLETYTGFDRVFKYFGIESDDTLIEESRKFDGISSQLKNFMYSYNNIPLTEDVIIDSFRTIVEKVSLDRILQKTTLKNTDLEETVDFFTDIIYNISLSKNISSLLNTYNNRFFGIYKNVINFDNGQYIKIIDHDQYFNDDLGLINIQVKLDNPLPSNFNVTDVCWISNVSISPFYFKVNLYTTKVSNKVFLNGVNFDVDVNKSYPNTKEFEPKQEDSLESVKYSLKNKINDLLIDYKDFNNFINYSSAELRTKVGKNKITEYDSFENSKKLISDRINSVSYNVSASLSLDYTQIISNQINLLKTFDDYESYLFYNRDVIDDNLSDGVEYDKQNIDSLINQLPEYLQNDVDSSEYLVFTSMVGHFFDNILNYIKKFPKTYPLNEKNFYPKNYIDELLESFNFKIDNFKFQDSSESQLLFNNIESSSSLSSSYFEYGKSLLNRIANNLPYVYKTKGTSTSFDLLRSMFGVENTLIELREYGSFGSFTNRDQYYEFDDIIYLTEIDSDKYITFDYTSEDYSLKYVNTYSASAAANPTSSYLETFNGVNAVECSFRIKDNTYDYQDKIPLIKKSKNETVEWEIFLKKEKHVDTGKLVFNLHPIGSNITSSIISKEMPFFNGNLYTLLLNREVSKKYDDSDELTETSVSNGSELKITSSLGEKYLPYDYKLMVNQYDGNLNNFSDKKEKTILYTQNKNFSSGSYYVGNYLYENSFKGNIDKIKLFSTSISDETFNEHSYNINSISTENKVNVYKNLKYLWSFETPINLWNSGSDDYTLVDNRNSYYNNTFKAYNFTGEIIRPYPNCTPVLSTKFPYQFEKLNFKQSINTSKYGPNYKNNTKIDKIEEFASSNLVPYDNSTTTNDIVGDDSNVVGFYISPYKYLNTEIEDFLGKDGVINDIGDPQYLFNDTFPSLDQKRKDFGKLRKKYIYPQESYSTYKFYIDFSIFEQVKQLSSNRTSLKSGLLIEPTVLEKTRIKYLTTDIENETPTSQSLINFDLSLNMSQSLYDLESTSDTIKFKNINSYKTEYNTYNFKTFVVNGDYEQDYVYAKYGKFININQNEFLIRDLYFTNKNEFFSSVDELNKINYFTSSYYQLEKIGSGSITGSSMYNDLYNKYKGDFDSGYSKRHLSKLNLVRTNNSYQAIDGSNNEFIYKKSVNDINSTVDREGITNYSEPIISINGFLAMELSASTFPSNGVSVDGEFVRVPITASLLNSSSLENLIYNL